VVDSVLNGCRCKFFVVFLRSLGADLELEKGEANESFTVSNIFAIIDVNKRRNFVLVELALVLA
jgi:hypothetical protein